MSGSVPAAPDSDITEPWGGPCDTTPVLVRSSAPGLALLGAGSAPSDTAPAAGPSVAELVRKLDALAELDDFSGALAVAEDILRREPGHPRAGAVLQHSRSKLLTMYCSRIGDLSAVPRRRIGGDELIWMGLDHRSGFVLSQVDGVSSYDEVIELASMDRLEACRILAQLLADKVIETS